MTVVPPLVLAVGIVLSWQAVAACGEERLRQASDDAYARLILEARSLGHTYRPEDILSGAERHFAETVARFQDAQRRLQSGECSDFHVSAPGQAGGTDSPSAGLTGEMSGSADVRPNAR
jgi:hypothetical protein